MNRLMNRAVAPAVATGILLSGCAESHGSDPQVIHKLQETLGGTAVELATQAVALSQDPNTGVRVTDDPDSNKKADVELTNLGHNDEANDYFTVSLKMVNGALDPSTVSEVYVSDALCDMKNGKAECITGSDAHIYAPNVEFDTVGRGAVKINEWAGEAVGFFNTSDGQSGGYSWNTVGDYKAPFGEDGNAVETAEAIAQQASETFDQVTQ